MSGTDHDHHHAHAETASAGRPGYYDMMETAVRELLVEKKLIGPDEIRRQIEVLDSRSPALGAKVVARAWVDPDFRARLLAHGRSACEQEFGITFYGRHRSDRFGEYGKGSQPDRLHLVLMLSAAGPWAAAGLVQTQALPRARRLRAARGSRRIRHHFAGRCRGARQRFDGDNPLSGAADAPQRNRALQRGAIGRARHARHHDRRRPGQD